MLQDNVQCIILAGGLGTRLRDTIGELPKCMAPVAGQPFLYYLFRYLESQQLGRVILSLGHKSEVIIEWLSEARTSLEVDYVVETEPLGTGGGIRRAITRCDSSDVVVLNGDTMFLVNLPNMLDAHRAAGAETTVTIKPMKDFDRYGTVATQAGGRIVSFREKEPCNQGDINGGIYAIRRNTFLDRALPLKFSFEKDYLEAFVNEGAFYAYRSDAYFIDIGVPPDFHKAQLDFQTLFPA